MHIIEIVLIGLALSADAMSVTVSNMIAAPGMRRSRALAMPIAFGLFQGAMPLLGYFAGQLAATFIEGYAGVIGLVILGFIGGKMIWDGMRGDDDEGSSSLGLGVLLLQAVATSIDAFAVGITFIGSGIDIWFAVSVIALCTFACCVTVMPLARFAGERLGSRAQVVGGIILIAIGIKNMWF